MLGDVGNSESVELGEEDGVGREVGAQVGDEGQNKGDEVIIGVGPVHRWGEGTGRGGWVRWREERGGGGGGGLGTWFSVLSESGEKVRSVDNFSDVQWLNDVVDQSDGEKWNGKL